jgi:membrane-bound lytic murein transglycosylase D
MRSAKPASDAAVRRRPRLHGRGREPVPELRPTARLILPLVLALAACASPGHREPPAEPPAAVQAPVEPDADALAMGPPEPVEEIAALPPLPPHPFSDIAAELEPLPASSPDIWVRVIAGYGVADVDGPLVARWEQWYAERPDYVARMIDRSRRYLYHIVNEVERRGMPLDVALLPMVESAFNPVALSTGRAAGIWQFVPATGRHYGLHQNFWFDSRRDVLAATDKALDYLQKLHRDFDDWQLALAAYNWGEGNVKRAIARNRARGLPADYASLAMPNETRNYLPKFQAVKNLVRDPERYGLVLADVPDAPYFTVVKTARRMDVKVAAELAEMPQDEFRALNPQHNRPVIAGGDEYSILLPIDRAEVFAAKLDLHDQPLVSWQAYRLRANESMAQVAAKFALDLDVLRAVNGLGPRSRVAAGQALLVPAERPSSAASESLAAAVFTTVPQGRTFYYKVRRGDTLQAIATKYNVTTTDLRQWNALAQNAVHAGQQLRVTSDVVAAKSRAGRRTAIGGARSSKGSAGPRTGSGKAHKATTAGAKGRRPPASAPRVASSQGAR